MSDYTASNHDTAVILTGRERGRLGGTGGERVKKKALATMIAYLLTCVILGLLFGSCATVRNDEKVFFQDLIQCAKTDPANAATATAALSCLESIAAQSYAQCLLVLPPIEQWAADEVICVAKALSTNIQAKANLQKK